MMRQELVFLKHWYKPGCVEKARPVPLAAKPDRVWTLFPFTEENSPPKLPMRPVHRENAFLEDYVHDWNWYENGRLGRAARAHAAPEHQIADGLGTFTFSSRVADGPVWVLLEYKE